MNYRNWFLEEWIKNELEEFQECCCTADSDIILAIITEGRTPKTALIADPTKRRCFDDFVDLLSTDIINLIYEAEKYSTSTARPVKHLYHDIHKFLLEFPELYFEIDHPFEKSIVKVYGLREIDHFQLPHVPFEVEEFVGKDEKIRNRGKICFGIYRETRFHTKERMKEYEQFIGCEHTPVKDYIIISIEVKESPPSRMRIISPLGSEQNHQNNETYKIFNEKIMTRYDYPDSFGDRNE